MEKKQKIILGIFLGIIGILFIIFLSIIISANRKKIVVLENVTPEKKTIVSQPITKKQEDINEIINTARGFIETFFSFSNSSEFSNIRDLYPFMTNNFKESADKIILENNGKNISADYYLKTTKVTNIGIKDNYNKEDGEAVVNVVAIEKNVDKDNNESIVEKTYDVYMIRSDKWRIEKIK